MSLGNRQWASFFLSGKCWYSLVGTSFCISLSYTLFDSFSFRAWRMGSAQNQNSPWEIVNGFPLPFFLATEDDILAFYNAINLLCVGYPSQKGSKILVANNSVWIRLGMTQDLAIIVLLSVFCFLLDVPEFFLNDRRRRYWGVHKMSMRLCSATWVSGGQQLFVVPSRVIRGNIYGDSRAPVVIQYLCLSFLYPRALTGVHSFVRSVLFPTSSVTRRRTRCGIDAVITLFTDTYGPQRECICAIRKVDDSAKGFWLCWFFFSKRIGEYFLPEIWHMRDCTEKRKNWTREDEETYLFARGVCHMAAIRIICGNCTE